MLELVPPYVRTSLMGDRQANDPHAMPLDEFIAEVLGIIGSSPASGEICVDRVKPLRHAGNQGEDAYRNQFEAFNQAMAAARQGE